MVAVDGAERYTDQGDGPDEDDLNVDTRRQEPRPRTR
jgi:hypothetical protein